MKGKRARPCSGSVRVVQSPRSRTHRHSQRGWRRISLRPRGDPCPLRINGTVFARDTIGLVFPNLEPREVQSIDVAPDGKGAAIGPLEFRGHDT